MSDAEMAVLREIYADWERGDFRPTHYVQPDFVLAYGSDFLDGGEYHGLAEVSRGWRMWLSQWASWKARATEYIPLGERILVLIEVEGVAKSTGIQLAQPSANVWEFRDGLPSRITLYTHVETALREFSVESP